MSTHTPGPWVIECGKFIATPDAIVIAELNDGLRGEYLKSGHFNANAQLIAAAPDMLKALEGCLRVAKAHYLDMVDQYTDDDPDIEEHLRHAHPNIAAAAMEVKRLETIIYKATGDV